MQSVFDDHSLTSENLVPGRLIARPKVASPVHFIVVNGQRQLIMQLRAGKRWKH